jgi:hypothetical protein
MKWLCVAWNWLEGLFRRQPRTWKAVLIEDTPVTPRPQIVYLIGEAEYLWSAAFLCPCGCGELVQLNLLPEARPCWTVISHPDSTVSVSPSIWRVAGCKSHFFLCRGKIEWC